MVAVTDDLVKRLPQLEQSRGYQVPFNMSTGTPIMQNIDDKGNIITPDEASEQYTKILTNQDFDYVPKQETAAVQIGSVVNTALSTKGGWLDRAVQKAMEESYGKDWKNRKYESGGKEISSSEIYAKAKQGIYDNINGVLGDIRKSLLFSTDEQRRQTVDELYQKGYLKEDFLPKANALHYISNVDKGEQDEELRQRILKLQVQREMIMDKLNHIPQPDHAENMAEFYARRAIDGSELYASDLRKIDKQIAQYNAVKDELEGRNNLKGEWRHAVKTSGVTDIGAWDFGVTDLKDAMMMYPLAKKMQNGDTITQDDFISLKLLSQANEADAVENAVMPSSYNMFKGSLQSAPFTVQFLAGGEFAKGATAVIDKAATRAVKGAILKAGGKKALRAAEKVAEKAADSKIIKFCGMLGKDFRQAFVMENTTGAATTGAEILNRHIGTVSETDDGFKIEGESLPTAIIKGEMSQNIELQTEFLGEHFPSSLKFIRGMAHTKVGSAMGLRNLAAWLTKVSRMEFATTLKSYATRAGINGVFGEYLEEVAGTAENALLVGDQKFSDLLDAKQQEEVAGSVVLSCLGMGIFGTAIYTGQRGLNMPSYYRLQHLQNKWDNAGLDLFTGEEWAKWKDRIDNTPNEGMKSVMADILRADNMSEEQARAAFNYARCSLTLRGMNIGAIKAAQLGLTDDRSIEQDNAYVEGRQAKDEEKHDIQIEFEDRSHELADKLGISEQQLDNMSDEELESLTGKDDQLDNLIYDYQTSHAKYQGVVDNADDEIDKAAQEAARQTDMATDKSRGTVRNATIKATKGEEDYGVYIVSGNVATNEDGSINVGESDDMILYYDPKTGKIEHCDALRFAALGEEVNAEETRNQAIADAKEKAIRKQAGIIDGTVGEGTTFTITDAQGVEHTYEVLAENGDGSAMITLDGNVQEAPVSLQDLQNLKDAEDAKSLEAAKMQRQQYEEEREKQNASIEDNLDYADIINTNGEVEIADVVDEEGNPMFPDAEQVFFVQNQGNRAKVMVLDNEGNLKAKLVDKSAVQSLGTMSVDEYKQERQKTLKEAENASEPSLVGETESSNNVVPTDNVTTDNVPTDNTTTDETQPGNEAGLTTPNETQDVSNEQENTPKITLEDGTEVPMLEDGNPDFSQLTAGQVAELYDTQFGEDAGQIISNNVDRSKKALNKANAMTVSGGSFVEQKASKEAKDKAIAEAKAKYDSAKAIEDAYNERMLAKEEDTPEGRQNLIEKARRKFNRMKSSVKDNAQAVAQLYNETVGALLHRLYDNTGIDVFDDTANTVDEYVASSIAPYSLNYEGTETSKGVKQETGLSRSDFAKTGLLAKEGKGKTIGQLANDLWRDRPSNLENITDQDVRNAIIDLITSGQTAFGLKNHIQNLRIAEAENILEQQKRQADELAHEEKQKEEESQKAGMADNNAEESSNTEATPADAQEEDKLADMPFEAPSPDEDAPFSAKDKAKDPLEVWNNMTDEEKAAYIEQNRVKDTRLVDDVIGKKLRKAIEKIAKMMGATIQWQRTDMIRNGWFNPNTKTIYLALDSSVLLGVQFVFGHEMTHDIKKESPAMYDELKGLVKEKYGEELFEAITNKNEQRYADVGKTGNDRSYYEEETVADAIGKTINDLNLTRSLALKMSHPLLAKMHDVLLKVKNALMATPYTDDVKGIIRTIEQVYVKTANGTFESSASEGTNDEKLSAKKRRALETASLGINPRSLTAISSADGAKILQNIDNLILKYKNSSTQPKTFVGEMADALDVDMKDKSSKYANFECKNGNVVTIRISDHNATSSNLDINGQDNAISIVVTNKNNIGIINDGNAHIVEYYYNAIKLRKAEGKPLADIVGAIKQALYSGEFKDPTGLAERQEVNMPNSDENVLYSLRQKPEPEKKGIGYKVFVLGKDGKLYPPMVANPNGAATPVGVWLDADAAPVAGESKTGRPQVKQGGKGTQGGSGKLAYRPGWHLGVIPYAIQFNRKDAEGNKTLFPKNFVFAEVEYAADKDYQDEAHAEGINGNGKYQHSLAGLKHLPTDGYYMYRTNPNPETDPWVITGAMKVNRLLTRAEQADIVRKAGREPQKIQEGDIVTDDVVNSINQEIAAAPKFSVKSNVDNQGNPLNQDGTLKLDKIKSVDDLTDEDFTNATRNVQLPTVPQNVDAAIGANGKPVIIKKNIFEKNWNAHKFTPAESRKVLSEALYNTDLVGRSQPTKKPNHWVAIKLDEKSPITVLEVNDNKDNVEVVGWYTLDERNLGRIKRQAERNGGELIMLSPNDKVESLSTPSLNSAANVDNSSETSKQNGEKFSLRLQNAISETDTEPTEAQKKSGNYKKGHVKFGGYDYTIENPKGSYRSGVDENGKEWKQKMNDTYGYIRGKFGKDGDHLDMFINDKADLDNWNGDVFVVDQVNSDGKFDEHKVMYGYDSLEEAKKAYLSNYEKGWTGLGNITPVSKADFDKWLDKSNRKLKPFADYADITSKTDTATAPSSFEEFLDAVRYSIRNEKERAAAEDAYNFAQENRPDRYSRYAIVNMEKPGAVPQYLEKKTAADNWRRYYNKLKWGNYKLFDLDKPFEDNVKNLVGKFPETFRKKNDNTLSKINELTADYNKRKEEYDAMSNSIQELLNGLMKQGRSLAEAESVIRDWGLYKEMDSKYQNLMGIRKQLNELRSGKVADGERYSLIGKKGAANLDHEEEFSIRLDNLSVARQMEEAKKDAEYLEAVRSGDMEKAQKMVYDAARAAGYVNGTDYQGEGSWNAPSASVEKEDFANLDVLRESVEEYSGDTNVFGIINGVTTNDDDFYYNPGRVGFRDAAASETSSVLRRLRYDKADANTKVKVYRTVPADVKGNKLMSGDWIALSKQYCIEHGNGRYGEGGYRIIEEEVPIKTIWNDGNDMREFGFDDGNNNEAEKNVPNNRKLLDAVTYDNNGNVIPLSERFNESNDDIRYSLKDEKTLAGVHNITEEKLRKVLKLGGFANPSLAVIDTNKTGHDKFGEISFIAPSALVDKESGHTAGTWTTDAYTQRYPSVERQMSDKGYDKFCKWVDGLDFTDSEKAEIKRQAADALEDNREPAWELMYLKEKGIDIKAYSSDVDYGWESVAETYGSVDDVLKAMEGDAELDEKIRKLVKVKITSPLMNKIRNTVRHQIQEETGNVPSPVNPAVRKRVREIFDKEYAPKLFDENGQVKSEDVRKIVGEMLAKYNDTKRFSFQKAKARASTYVHNNGMYTDYLRWQEEKLDDYGTKGRIFRGYKNDGTRKYVPETLENVSKAMREEADGQTNGSEYTSFGSFIAKLASRVDSTDEMRANKDKLSSNEDKEEFYEKWNDVYYDLAKFLYNDVFYGEQRLHDIVLQSDPKKYAKKEYGITLTPTFMKKLDALKNAVRTELKSAYFETKYNRPLRLNEFAAAVVPDNLGEDVRKGIENAGLPMYDYDPTKEGDRSRAFNEAINSSDNIRFSLKEEKEKIVSDAKANGTYMTAPNGEKTKLNAEQWVTVRTTNFKNWFGDWENDPENASKVVDENGEPMVVWHGRSAEFNTFEKKEGVRFIMGLEDKVKAEGFFFSPNKGLAEEFASNSSRHRGGKANVIPCFLNIRKPMDLTREDYDRIYEDVTGWDYIVGMDTQDNLWGIMDEEGMADKIKGKGYDGAIFVEEVDDSYEPTKISYCALDANQIKSAENNNGDFSADNNDIRFSLKSMMEKPEGWKQANKKAIHIAEAIERDPKFSLKNLDGTLIKAGTYFSGGGLVEEGLKGIVDPVIAVEYDEKISGVYRNNFGNHIVTADVRDIDPKELVDKIDGDVEYFHASPVCKNYSLAKNNHEELELDKETAASTAEFIKAVKPKVVTIENVKGYKDSEAMKTITDALDEAGYKWDANVYNAADYGGYTNRERLIVRAVLDGELPAKPQKQERKSGWYEAVEDIIPTLTEKKNGVASWMDERLKADGIDWRRIDKPLYVMGSGYANGTVPHAFADELLPTLRTKSGDVIVMPDGKVYRAMGRVLARVSGVSDDYQMPASEALSHTIIGNGIPTQLTENVIAPLVRDVLHPVAEEERASLKEVNDKFNDRLAQLIENPNQKDRILHLGRSSQFLIDGGIADAEIELDFDKFVRKSSEKYKNNHPFSAGDIKDLPKAIAHPVAVFNSTTKKDHVVMTELNHDGKNFIVAIRATEQNRKNKVVLEENQITSLYPKGERGIIYWINNNKLSNVDKEKALHFIEALQPHAGTLTSEELSSAANIVRNFVNPKQNDGNLQKTEKYSLRVDRYRDELNQWKKDNNLPKDAERPQLPVREPNESAADFLKRVKEYRKQAALWATAPTYEDHLLVSDTAQGQFNLEMQRKAVLARIVIQDSMLAIRKAQEAIMKEVGVDKLNFAEDAYTAENRSHGKAKNEFEEYNDEFLQPLRKAYNELMQRLGKSYDNVKVYMIAKHGLERNAHIAFKYALDEDFETNEERMDAYNNYKSDMDRLNNDADFEAGRIDFAAWKQRDGNIRTKYAPSYFKFRFDENGITKDYSGLSALFDADDYEGAAADLVKDVEDANPYFTDELWYATNDATKKILRDSYNAGMMTEDNFNFVSGMYRNYIPLRGWGDTNADQVWNYVGGGKGAFSQVVKEAKGRKSLADDPIAYIENMAESAILMNNRNWVKQHLLLLAQNHRTSLLHVSKAWYIKTKDAQGNEEWVPASPQITEGMTSRQVEAALEAFEQKMEQMKQNGEATQKREHLEISYPQTNGEEREHEVRVMKGGEEYVIYVNGDPQLAQAVNNTRARKVREGLESSLSAKVIARTGRYMAAAYTSMSPLFIPSNYMRDLTMTLASTAIREDARYNYLLRRNMLRHWNTFPMVLSYQNGTLREKVRNGSASEVEKMFYDFMMNGGETGFVTSIDVEDLKKKFRNDLKDLNRMAANPKKVGHIIMDSIETLNRAIEDSNRFMVYMTSIQYGRSIEEAVNNAKDVTLNFNRKGTGEHWMQNIRNLYLFINPAIQSLQTLGALAKHHRFKFTAVTTGWLATGLLAPMLNNLLMSFFGGDDDKDKYWQFTKWDRRNNFIMWIPFTKEFVKIPLAQEFRGFYGVGDMIASKLWGGEKAEESWRDYAVDLMGQIVDMLPLDPTGYDGNVLIALMPNAFRPIFELGINVDFTGKPIFKDSEYNKYDPNFTKAYVGTPDWLVRISKMVNSIDNKYPDVQQNAIDRFGDPRFNLNNPAVIDHLLSSYLGGSYTMGSQIIGVATKALNGDDIKMADIPLASKFVSNPDDRPVSKKQGEEFWDMKERHDRAANTLSKLKQKAKVDGDYSTLDIFFGSDEYKQYKEDDKKVKKYEEDRKKEKAQETGEAYRPHKTTADDVYKSHTSPKDDFEDMKMKQLYEKLNSYKIRYEAIDGISSEKGDAYYKANKAAIDAIEEIAYDKSMISTIKKGFLSDGQDSYDADGMKDIREMRKRILDVLEKANKTMMNNRK